MEDLDDAGNRDVWGDSNLVEELAADLRVFAAVSSS